jgi:hypothetical protein
MEWIIAIVGFLGGWGITHAYHKISGHTFKEKFERLRSDNSTLKKYMEELLLRYDRTLSKKEEKEHFRADSTARLEGVFHTFPWEAEYAKEIAGEADIMTGATQVKAPHSRGKYGVVPSFLRRKDSNGEED